MKPTSNVMVYKKPFEDAKALYNVDKFEMESTPNNADSDTNTNVVNVNLSGLEKLDAEDVEELPEEEALSDDVEELLEDEEPEDLEEAKWAKLNEKELMEMKWAPVDKELKGFLPK